MMQWQPMELDKNHMVSRGVISPCYHQDTVYKHGNIIVILRRIVSCHDRQFKLLLIQYDKCKSMEMSFENLGRLKSKSRAKVCAQWRMSLSPPVAC